MTRTTKVWLVAAGVFLVMAVLAWFLGTWLGLRSPDVWMLRGALWLLALVAVGTVLWFVLRADASRPPDTSVAAGNEDIDHTVSAARSRLAASSIAEKSAFGTMPMLLIMGPEGSAKTTSVVRSGVEAELLAGEVARGDVVAPTPTVNVWYAQRAIVLEAGGKLLEEPARWSRVIHHFQPTRLGAVLAGKIQAPRMAVVCVSCEDLLRAGSTQNAPALATALRTRLGEVSQRLGIRLPVYVMFTKMDRIPYFADYVATLTRDEAQEVLGATLPADLGVPAASYADREAARLNAAMQQIFQGLAEHRLVMLAREHAADRKPGSYEFPREFRKLAPVAVQFLVELCRPSQLQVSPFLRGFYFSGVQAVYVSDVAPAPAQPAVSRTPAAVGATSVFSAAQLQAQAAVVAPAVSTRKVPRWDFLGRFFRDVVLTDRVAMGVTSGGAKVNFLRRAALGAVAAAAVLLALAWTVSYAGNRRLAGATLAAAQELRTVPASEAELPTRDALARLDSLRARVAELHTYERDGAPLHLRWGLWQHDLWPEAQRAYFNEFRRLMFAPTHAALLASLRALPDTPADTADYGTHYNNLKAYLITTSHPEKSTAEFLSPVLLARWTGARQIDPDRAALARRQFDFYAEELRDGHNPYALPAEMPVVTHARAFLNGFKGFDRIYQNLIAEASRGARPVQFNRDVPGSAAYVVDSYEVPGAFTKVGWARANELLKSADRVFQGETWVLGEQAAAAPVDKQKVLADLRARYVADYLKHWETYLKSASVVRYSGLRDAGQKLGVLSGPTSPLLNLFALAARNTDVDPHLKAAMQPVHTVTPPAVTDRLISETTAPYVQNLGTLKLAVDAVATAPAGQTEAAAQQTQQNAQQAKGAVLQIAQKFSIDSVGHSEATVQKLLTDPITYVDPFTRNLGAKEVEGASGTFCSALGRVMGKFPFNPSSPTDATLDEVNDVFRPVTGKLWQFYAATLQKLLTKQGTQYVPVPGGGTTLTPGFVHTFNRAAQFSDALYASGPDPRLSFTLRPVLSDAIPSVTLSIDGQATRFTKGAEAPKAYVWSGASGREARISGQLGTMEANLIGPYTGTWAVFHLFYDAETFRPQGSTYLLEWAIRTGGRQATLPDGTPIKIVFELNMGALPPVLRKGELGGMRCGQIAQ